MFGHGDRLPSRSLTWLSPQKRLVATWKTTQLQDEPEDTFHISVCRRGHPLAQPRSRTECPVCRETGQWPSPPNSYIGWLRRVPFLSHLQVTRFWFCRLQGLCNPSRLRGTTLFTISEPYLGSDSHLIPLLAHLTLRFSIATLLTVSRSDNCAFDFGKMRKNALKYSQCVPAPVVSPKAQKVVPVDHQPHTTAFMPALSRVFVRPILLRVPRALQTRRKLGASSLVAL